MKMRTNLWLVVTLLIFGVSLGAWANEGLAPLSYQGRLLADGEPVPNGEYTLTLELFEDAGAAERICGDRNVTLDVLGGYFNHSFQDPNCAEGLRSHTGQVYVRVLARGGVFGDQDVKLGIHPISTSVFAIHAASGGGVVGDIVASMLTPEEFRALRGDGWVLADGRAHPGSTYEDITGRETVPDLRGVFLRGKDHGRMDDDGRGNPDGDLALGEWQGDAFEQHSHEVLLHVDAEELIEPPEEGAGGNGENGNDNGNENGEDNGDPVMEDGPALPFSVISDDWKYSVETSEDGEAETRPRSVTVNYFIKID